MKYLIPVIKKSGHYVIETSSDLSLFEQCYNNDFIAEITSSYSKIEALVNYSDGPALSVVYTNNDDDDYSYILKDHDNSDTSKPEHSNSGDIDFKTEGFIENQFNRVYQSEYTDEYCKINLLNNYLEVKIKNELTSELLRHSSILNYQKVILIGSPGSGKTTLFRRISSELIYNYKKSGKISLLPFYIQLRKLNFTLNLIESILGYVKEEYQLFDLSTLETILSNERVVLLLDGLDEIAAVDREKLLFSILNQAEFKKAKIFISSRNATYLNAIQKFTKLHIQPFSNTQIKELSYRKLKNSNWKDYYHILCSNEQTHDIVRNPLLLNQSLNLYETKSNNPSNTGVLIRYFIDTLVSNWNNRRGIYHSDFKLNPDKIKFLLSKLAYHLQTSEKFGITSKDFKLLFDLESISDASTILDNIQQITGVLRNDGDNWIFSHKSLLEYFCAFYLIERSKGLDNTYQTFGINVKWSNVWKKSFGLSLDPEFYVQNQTESYSIEYINMLIKCQEILRESIILEKYLIEKIISKTISFYVHFNEFFSSEKVTKSEENIINKKILRFKNSSRKRNSEDDLKFRLVIRLNFLLLETRWTIYSKSISKNLKKCSSKLLNDMNEIYIPHGKSICAEHENYTDYYLSDEIQSEKE